MAAPYWQEAVYTLISKVPPGRVCSYGKIAKAAGVSNARQVAQALRNSSGSLPWYRIINSSMKISDHPGAEEQRRLLREEGVGFTPSGKVKPEFLWNPQ